MCWFCNVWFFDIYVVILVIRVLVFIASWYCFFCVYIFLLVTSARATATELNLKRSKF